MKRRRALNYALMAAVAAVMGLLLLRAPFGSGSLTADFFSNRYTFTYLFVAIAVTFLGLGYVLGRQADTLRRLSSTDPLTGLCNRRALDHRLRQEWDRAARYGSPLALLLIDVDGLKQVNEALGHSAAMSCFAAWERRSVSRCGAVTSGLVGAAEACRSGSHFEVASRSIPCPSVETFMTTSICPAERLDSLSATWPERDHRRRC